MRIGLLLVLVCAATAVGLVAVRSQKSGSVAKEVRKLYSGDDADRNGAKKRLLGIAGRSPEMRGEVIKALLGVLGDPHATYGTWSDAAGLAGDLRATEAVDLLVERLDYNDGTVGFSASHYPALKAVISIGEAAVPKLEKALVEGPPSIRGNAARALGAIGGGRSQQALTRASTTETNEEVKAHIRNALLKVNKQ
jgi:HEAT repeat protein